MKIAVISPSEIPSRRANSIQTMKMCQAFVQIGHEVKLFVPGKPREINWNNLQAHYGLTNQFEIDWIPHLPKLKKYDFSVKAVLNAKKWGALMVFSRLLQVAALSDFVKIPSVLEIHDTPSGKNGPKLLKKFLSSKFAVGLVSITHALQNDILKYYPSDKENKFYRVLPDGVDLERYQNLPSSTQARKDLGVEQKFTVGYTGHLYPGRGGQFILKIAQLCPDINFLLVGGETKDIDRLSTEVESLGIKNVNLVGFVKNSKLPHYQAAADILLMPYQKNVSGSSGGDISKYLSPMKLFEYLATGRVIMASNLPVLQEILTNENSIILDGNKEADWVNAIKEVNNNPKISKALGRNGKQTAQKLEWKQRTTKIVGLLD